MEKNIINYKILGERIKKIRLERKFTQEELGFQASISSVYVSHIEVGSAKPSLEVLVKLCNALNTTPDLVLFDSLNESKGYIHNEIADLLKDCDNDELRLITELIKTVKKVRN